MSTPLDSAILRTLLYYDIWHYPLNAKELFTFLPINSLSFDDFRHSLAKHGAGDMVVGHEGYYFLKDKNQAIVTQRVMKERRARWMWQMARLAAYIIKRFPFVRAVFVSGDLSKNVTNRDSDVDFFIVTAPNRLWITRTLLILFKKIFLFNSKKFFCLNYFITSDHLRLDEQNVYAATEIAHLKPLFNSRLFFQYLHANDWINKFFPNFDISSLSLPRVDEKPSLIQRFLELPFLFLPSDRIDWYFLRKMKVIWAKRYPEFDEETRNRIFRSTRDESRAYVGNFQDK
ncbi:MAG: hypothetical protein O7D34_11380, partial [Ignavibacteria bacterium]|nr:hypothetical protein [Ignavibacteria bacterium]